MTIPVEIPDEILKECQSRLDKVDQNKRVALILMLKQESKLKHATEPWDHNIIILIIMIIKKVMFMHSSFNKGSEKWVLLV